MLAPPGHSSPKRARVARVAAVAADGRRLLPLLAPLLLGSLLRATDGGYQATQHRQTKEGSEALALTLPRLRGARGGKRRRREGEGEEEADEGDEGDEAEGCEDAGSWTAPSSSDVARGGDVPFNGDAIGGLLNIDLVELEVEEVLPWRSAKVLIPLEPEVALWWASLDGGVDISIRDESLTGQPQILVRIRGWTPLFFRGKAFRGVQAVVTLREDAILKECRLGTVSAEADIAGLAGLGHIRALLVVCPVTQSNGSVATAWHAALGGRRSPLGWLLLPWIVLLLPFIIGSTMGPAAVLGGACLTLASFASLSFAIAFLLVAAQRRCAHCSRRWRRLWRLRRALSRKTKVATAFGQDGPCCICLGEESTPDGLDGTNSAGPLIVMLPCRHALHRDCYISWVRADSYPSRNLICPLCRRRTEAIGHLGI